MSRSGLDTQTVRTIEAEFNRWDTEFEARERTFIDTADIQKKLQDEQEQIAKSLDETVEKFNELLDLLDKEHVVFPSGTNLNQENYEKIVDLSKIIYEEAMLTLHLTKDFDLSVKEKVGFSIQSIINDSLKKKIKAHFILAELYTALGVRTDPSLEDRSAKAEYEKVIAEGEQLYGELKHEGEDCLKRIRLSHNIAASYKRIFDLFEEAQRSEKYGYVKGSKGAEKRHDLIKKARDWYAEMFDIQNTNPNTFFETAKIFPTEYEFKRYQHDIEELKAGCFFQNYAVKPEDDPETGKKVAHKFFKCSKLGEPCKHYQDRHCIHLEGTRDHANTIARVEIKRNLF